MAGLTKASAYANNEVAYIAWTVAERLDGCLGFEIMREYLDDRGRVTDAVPLAAYVAFRGQSNPDWTAQNTSLWPVQKFSWRDLTLRKRRDEAERRPTDVRVRYAIRPVCRRRQGLPEVVPRKEGKAPNFNTYDGDPVPLSYMTDAVRTRPILITSKLPPFYSTFTNGMLSGQWLVRALKEDDGRIGDGELKQHLVTPGDRLRRYLSGDVLETLEDLFGRQAGRLYLALYELDDVELEQLILDNAERISLILSNTGLGQDEGDEVEDKVWDARNAPARRRLIERAARRGTRFELQHRLFNNSIQIGHNKFAVWVDGQNRPRSVITGSTNWTWSGLTGQSNNLVRIDHDGVARAFLDYWQRLAADPQPVPDPTGTPQPKAVQGAALRTANTQPAQIDLGAGKSAEIWFAPNTKSRKYGSDPAAPPDLGAVFSLMRKARRAIFFLAFYPSRQGRYSIIEQAVDLGLADPSLLVVGAVSTAEAMFNFKPKQRAADATVLPAESPFVYQKNAISVVRAAAISDRALLAPFGNFEKELLKVGNAIIHDKIVVIDPLDPHDCTVVFGSHNHGYKASYSNDENMVVVRGHAALAEAYAVHVLDVYDHYRFRAATAELKAEGKKGWDGFLDTNDRWQDHSGRLISDYFAG